MNTQFGKPSDKLLLGEIAGREVVFLPRHGGIIICFQVS